MSDNKDEGVLELNKENKNRVVELDLNSGEKVKVRLFLPLRAVKTYFELKNSKESYRDKFLSLVYYSIIKKHREKVEMQDLRFLSEEVLIDLGYKIINYNDDLKLYFKEPNNKDEFYQKFIESLEAYLENQLKDILSLFKSAFSEEMVESFYTVLKNIASYTKRTFNFFNDFSDKKEKIIKSFKETISSLYENIEGIDKINNKFSLIMIETGWPIPLDIPVDSMFEIVEIYESCEKEYMKNKINEIIVSHYNEQILKKRLEIWKKKDWLKERIEIIESALKAHIEDDYFLSIPTLLPQIEGMIYDRVGHEGWANYSKFEEFIEELLEENDMEWTSKAIKSFISDIILVNFRYGFPLNSSLSRHAIIHGADTDYGTEINSLKIILLLDYLQDIM